MDIVKYMIVVLRNQFNGVKEVKVRFINKNRKIENYIEI